MSRNPLLNRTLIGREDNIGSAYATAGTRTVNIIGGGVGAIFFAQRVRRYFRDNQDSSSYSVNIFFEGNTQAIDTSVALPYYAVQTDDPNSDVAATDLHNFNKTQIHITSTDSKVNTTKILLTPNGLMGDAVNSYYVDLGPWIWHDNSSGISKIIDKYTLPVPYTNFEMDIVNIIMQRLNTNGTRSRVAMVDYPVIETPSMINFHYPFIRSSGTGGPGSVGTAFSSDRFSRRLGFDVVDSLMKDPNVTFYGNCSNWAFTQVSARPPVFTVSCTSGPLSSVIDPITGALYFKLLPPDFLRIATVGGLAPQRGLCYAFPTEYRRVFAIPKQQGGWVDQMIDEPWMLGTNITMSLPDLMNPLVSVGWTVQAYTVVYDVVTKQYADADRILLIIEAAAFINKRKMYYDLPNRELRVLTNDFNTEGMAADQFTQICGIIYNAYTGQAIINPTLISGVDDKCTAGGLCSTVEGNSDCYLRVFTQLQLINIVSMLFDLSYYQSVSTTGCAGAH